VQPLDQLQKTNMEFTRIQNDPKMNPAEKVTGLLAAVGISFDPLKGKGARMTQSVIGEHAESRDIYQSAIQKLDQLVPGGGGPITEKQVRDYANIAQVVVHDAYVNASWRAQEQGVDSTKFLPRAMLGKDNQKPVVDPVTAKVYLDAAHGDTNKAHQALIKNGFAE
jgi:hypothetical protein